MNAAAQNALTLPHRLDLAPTPSAWTDCVLADFPAFLQDHASNEKKASGMALSVASHYPDRPRLLSAMADLAVEELTHYREVVRLLIARGLTPGPDTKDHYVRALNNQIRKGPAEYLLDRLLVAAVVEARGHERFGLLAEKLPPGPEQRFYSAISASEDRHWQLFVNLACSETADPADQDDTAALVFQRLGELISVEAQLITQQPLAPRLH